MKPGPIKEKVMAEGAEIYCERRGNGPLLLLITGGMGDAGFYSSADDILANIFTVAVLMTGGTYPPAQGIEQLT